MKQVHKEVMIVVALLLILFQAIQLVSIINIEGAAVGNANMCVVGSPQLTTINNQTTTAGTLYTYQLDCNTQCQEESLYNITTTPALNPLSFNSSNGTISFTPTAEDIGAYTINASCYKIGQRNSQIFILNITGSSAPTQFSCSNNDHTVLINWTDSGADNYTIYHSENISAIRNLNVNNIPQDVISNTTTELNWNDTNAFPPTYKYYTLGATSNGITSLTSDMPCVKYTYKYSAPESEEYGTLASNRISIYFNVSYSAEEFLQEIPGALNPTISRLDKSDGSGEYLTTHVRGLNDGNNYQIETITAYQLTVDDYHNHTITGKLFETYENITFTAPESEEYGTLATNWKGIYDEITNHSAESTLQLLPGVLNPTISRLDKSDESGEYLTTHVRGLNDGNDFNIIPGVGYAFTTDGYHNLSQCEECFE